MKVAASRANAQPAPTPAIRAVASAGPSNSATWSEAPLSAFASWISSSGTSCGIRPVRAGRKKASAVPNAASIATSCHTRISPVRISTASSPCKPPRTRSVTTTTRWRGSRSAHTPPTNMNSTSGAACAPSTSPTSVADPVWLVTNRASATTTRRSPITLALWPIQNRRKSGRLITLAMALRTRSL